MSGAPSTVEPRPRDEPSAVEVGHSPDAGFPALTPVQSATSKAVQEMYEENPYPEWDGRPLTVPRPLAEHLRHVAGADYDPAVAVRRPRLLVAGCGTGQELMAAALTWQPAAVTAFDVSLASLALAQARADECGVNVEFYQADLAELDSWDRQFDVVVCTGVLHHLDDPLLGWRNLVRLLSAGGVMLVGLYSRLARTGVRAAQSLVRARGFAPTPDGIAEARALVMELPDGHPGRDCLLLGDFYNLSGCRDMLFHVREHDFTLTEIASDLDEVGLEFLGLEVPPAVRSRYRTLFGWHQRLAYWDAFERWYPRTFLGMYMVWCRKPSAQPEPGVPDPRGSQ